MGWTTLAISAFLEHEKAVFLSDTLAFPGYIASVSATILIVNITFSSNAFKRLQSRVFQRPSSFELDDSGHDVHVANLSAEFRVHISHHGGGIIFAYKVARLVGCLALLGLSTYPFALDVDVSNPQGLGSQGKWGKKHKHMHKGYDLSVKEWLDLSMCMNYLYGSLLALMSLSATSRWSNVASKHLIIMLIATFGIYFYRDLFPLATFTRTPRDLSEGWVLWTKVVILALTSIGIPLFIPRQYKPVDPEDPMAVPNAEQTASIFSLVIYSFLDPIVFLAYRVPLTHDQLPPLADYDYARHLTEKSFPHLDLRTGVKKPHLFFGLMRVFRKEYTILTVTIILQVFVSFAGPVGIKQLLGYLETHGKDAIMRPWFWIIWLFAGPMVGTIAWQWYIYIATRTLVRAECIITQLIFEHSLRIRFKAESNASSGVSADTSPTTTSLNTKLMVDLSLPSSDEESALNNRPNETESDTLHSRDETLHASSSSEVPSTSSIGKDKVSNLPKDVDKDKNSSGENLVGKINNLVTTDLANIVEARDFLLAAVYIPLQITLCIIFLYVVLGWSAFVGLAIIVLLFPLPGYVTKLIQDVQVIRLKKTDARVQIVTELMNVLRMIKMFGWEKKMDEKVSEKREAELKWIWRRQLLDLISATLNYLIPVITMVATYSTYTVIMKQRLSASKVFSSITVFDMLRDQLHMILYAVTQAVTGKVSLDRVNDFLHNTELLDSFSEKESINLLSDDNHDRIGFRTASFVWSSDTNGSLTPSRRKFVLRIEDELIFERGRINLIIGPTGSGKTSLLMALLGEMHFLPSSPQSWYNLPRDSGVAYAAQEYWVQNETIRANIVFGAQFDEARYKKVIHQCCLERDLELFEAGDQTEVGEKGLTLSGGQKARITLARAIYSQASILLLDDVLAALDAHTAKWIIDKCLSGDLIHGRTVLLVTHNVAMARPIASFVVAMRLDGRVSSQGSITDALLTDSLLDAKITKEEHVLHEVDREIDHPTPAKEQQNDGKLIVAEEVEQGHVSWPSLKLYLLGLGGNHPFLFFSVFACGLLLTELSNAIQTRYLGHWASQYDQHDPSEVAVFHYLGVYVSLVLSAAVIICCSFVIYIFGALRASRSVHKQLVESLLGTTLRWLDVTPISRVITRCTQDMRAVDGPIPTELWWLAQMTIAMLVKFGAVVCFSPAFFLPGVSVAIVGGWCGQVYMAAQLSVKRNMSNAKAPVLGHFGAAIAGLPSIRAYGAQTTFKEESLRRINHYTRAARTFYNLNRWICIRVDAISGMFATSLAAYLVYFQGQSAASIGFSLNMAVGFSSQILWWIRVLNDFEVQGNSLERIQGYVNIEQEPKPSERGIPPAYWPASGEIRVENLSAKYSADGAKVLHDLSFHVKSGERIGVVGRTGSGKSSLTLSLLRCIFTEGNVYYDGLNINSVNLDSLRSNITIIPQVPELLSGTLRRNLDPFEQYDDATLNDALRAAGLYSLQSEMDGDRINLDSSISGGGSNLSVGQRQILALARAIVRGSKLLILDEATSAIDHKTDSVIQSSLRRELGRDVTLITVAHRLQTIMDADKIMVLNAGRIVEFNSPKELLRMEGGRLRALVDDSGDRDTLYAMAERKTTP